MAKGIRAQTIAKKQKELRSTLWPEVNEEDLWQRQVKLGFTTIPRTMPLIMQIIDSLSKGKPASSVYLNLWCKAFDEHIITLTNKEEFAFHSGYTGQRAVQTLFTRLDILNAQGFIKVKSGPHGDRSYILIMNPYKVIKAKFAKNKSSIPADLYTTLVARCIEIGANEL